MAHKAVFPGFGGQVTPVAYVPLHRFDPERWTGRLTVLWQFECSRPLVVGSGRLAIRERPGSAPHAPSQQELVADVVRRGPEGMPVIPGSSIKGAARQVFELITPSCDVLSNACRIEGDRPKVCPACSLFGGQGLAGRVTFFEAVMAPDAWRRQMEVRTVPQGWKAQKPVPGSVRAYGENRARDYAGGFREEVEKTYAVHGVFAARIHLLNSSPDELGLLAASLGLGWERPGPSLRLGGRKYHGFGAAKVCLFEAQRLKPQEAALPLAEAEPWAKELRDAALGRASQRRSAWENLHLVLANTE